jgi:PASTA domain
VALRRIASAFGKLGAAAVIAAVFAFGVLATVYLSIRSPEIQVPEVVNQSYTDGEATLEKAGLDIRERAKRYKPDVQPGIILDQSPRAGETIKAGQTIAVVVSRGPKEGEQPPPPPAEESDGAKNENAKANENSASNKNENANRERPKNTNRNTNRNANGNAATNLNGNRNANAANTRNSNANANRGANSNRTLNTNANSNRPRTTTNTNTNTRNVNAAPTRNTSPTRPAANANRRP